MLERIRFYIYLWLAGLMNPKDEERELKSNRYSGMEE